MKSRRPLGARPPPGSPFEGMEGQTLAEIEAKTEAEPTNCAVTCTLAADVVAATYAPPEDQPRQLRCERGHPHKGPHRAEGWEWENGQIWKASPPEGVQFET